MTNEPDLNEPGKPSTRVVDGVTHELRRTKFETCQELMGEIGDRYPTTDELARWELTKAEYDHFLLDLHDEEADLRDRMAVSRANHGQMTGHNLELPELEKDRRGLSHLKQDPEPTAG